MECFFFTIDTFIFVLFENCDRELILRTNLKAHESSFSSQESVYETFHFEVYYTKYIMDVEIFWE